MNLFMNRKVIVFSGILLVLILIGLLLPVPMPVSFSNKMAFSDPQQVSYDGDGVIYVCAAEGDVQVTGENTALMKAPVEPATGRERSVLVYTPPGFDKNKVYPVLYLLHGFAAHPAFWVENLIPFIDTAVLSGELTPLVVVMPDGSLSGNGKDDPATKVDERGGCWYINSNRVMFEDFMLMQLPVFVSSIAQISADAGHNLVAGSSMGGFGAAYYSVRYPERFKNAGLFYPALDLRYTVEGNRLKDFSPDGYEAVVKDRPLRIVNKAAGGDVLGLTEKWCYYPVFDSDSVTGAFWQEDLPVWQRLEAVNPADLLREGNPELNGSRFFVLTGSEDDFNFDDHQLVVFPLIKQAGGTVAPEQTIIPGGQHNWDTIAPQVPDFISWLDDVLSD